MCDVVIIGGRNSSVEAALELYRAGARVTLVHRQSELSPSVKYWIKPDMENRIKEGSIAAQFNSVVTEIRDGELDIKNGMTGETEVLKADFVLALIGYRPDEKLLRSAGVKMDAETLIPEFDAETFVTNVPGCYIAGSVACGCKTWEIFIENSRAHAAPIINHITTNRV